MAQQEIALIVGSGPGLSASLARLFKKEGMKVAMASRNVKKLDGLVKDVDGRAYACDASSPTDVKKLFQSVSQDIGDPNLVVYNASGRVRGPVTDLDPEDVRQTILITCYGGFLIGQEAAKRMIKAGSGTILFTGASASVKGYANSSAFAGQDGVDRASAKHGARAAVAKYSRRSGGDRRWNYQPGASHYTRSGR